MVLRAVDGELITRVAREADFDDALRRLGPVRADEVRNAIEHAIDHISPDPQTGRRTFNSTHLGHELAPWTDPLAFIDDVARAIEGPGATAETIEERSSWIFGLFIWEHLMNRDEDWRFYDPNAGLRRNDPNREPIGKTYFEE